TRYSESDWRFPGLSMAGGRNFVVDWPWNVPTARRGTPPGEGRNAMELKQLKYFLCVAEVGSFSRAAVMLSVAQPILSRQIKALEQALSAELFYRNGRGIVLSEAGKLLEGYAKEIIGTVDRASFEITAMKSAPSGRITIAMPPSIGWVLTVPLVHRCRREFPMIALHVVEGFSGHVTEWLSTGRIDIGVV